MQPEPNNKMDELLKRLTKERQAKTGVEFQLHPATRRILQGEVARTFPQPGEKPLFFFSLWPRLALMGVFTALLALTLMVLNTPRKSERAVELSQRSDQPVSPASQAVAPAAKEKMAADTSADKDATPLESTAPTESVSLNKELNTPLKFDRAEAATGGRARDILAESRDPIGRTESKSAPIADKRLAANRPTANSATKAREEAVAPTPAPVARSLKAEIAPATAPAQGFAAASAPARRRFVQQDSRARFRQNLQSPPPSKILQSFEFTRVGNKIQLFDSDGSVYVGEILNTARPDTTRNELQSAAPTSSEFAFQAAGTNQRLHRLVTINGSFALTNAGKKANEPSSASKEGALNEGRIINESDIGGITAGSIQGRISIGGTNEFEIHAIELPR